jgi:hypothetical protein
MDKQEECMPVPAVCTSLHNAGLVHDCFHAILQGLVKKKLLRI